MAMCTFDGNAKETAAIASDLYARAISGDSEAAINFSNVMSGINNNTECDTDISDNVSGQDQFVQEVHEQLSGPLALVAQLGTGQRTGYPRLDETETVSEIKVPVLDFGKLGKKQ
jgi:hypothetical protein